MKILIAMDKFKGSLTSIEAGNAVREGILEACPRSDCTVVPLADGGEGTGEALIYGRNGKRFDLKVKGPLQSPVDSCYYAFDDTAVIESSKASGLCLVPDGKSNIMRATSYGTGELIKDALERGYRKIIVCIGGSAVNDGGTGMLTALGFKFKDKCGSDIPLGAIGLRDLRSIEYAHTDADITVACDVKNPLCGPDGASFVYAPQKGASEEQVILMDAWLRSYADLTGFDPSFEGAGAAGGLGFALHYLLGARLVSGADLVTETLHIKDQVKNADLIITGEGRMDAQTVCGKAPIKIASLAASYGKPAIAVAGCLGEGSELCLSHGLRKIFTLDGDDLDPVKAASNVRHKARQIAEGYIPAIILKKPL